MAEPTQAPTEAGGAERTPRRRAKRRAYLVSVTRTSYYRVQARDEEHAIDVYMDTDPAEVFTETQSMDAEEDDNG